jgi:hypothetical protein
VPEVKENKLLRITILYRNLTTTTTTTTTPTTTPPPNFGCYRNRRLTIKEIILYYSFYISLRIITATHLAIHLAVEEINPSV